MNNSKPLIGFIGQGWIGKNYANDFEARGYETVRYALEEPYRQNKEKIHECDFVFIAVPTPTTPTGFDGHIVEDALSLLGPGKVAVIKSTILPGTTKKFQEKYPGVVVVYSPEFLSEATAAYDSSHPFSNIVGIAEDLDEHRGKAKELLAVLPKAPFELICSSTEAEIVKYSHNVSGYMQILFFNMMYDFAQGVGAEWATVRQALIADPFIASRYSEPVHKNGRGAGGHCFIKDFASFKELYKKTISQDTNGRLMLDAMERKNIELLTQTGKDLDLLRGVYGDVVQVSYPNAISANVQELA